jgi:acetyltransferase
LFGAHNVATYETPDKAINGFMHLVRYRQGQEQLLEVPPSLPAHFRVDAAQARRTIDHALAAGQHWLNEAEIADIFRAYAIDAPRSGVAPDEERAAELAEQFARAVALKIHSPDITHKSDVGGVVLGLQGRDAVLKAAHQMRARVAEKAPDAQITGFLVQEMIEKPQAYELIVGMTLDPVFGPVLLFGRGGTAVEVINDKAISLAPLNLALARDLITRTRVYNELKGYRDRGPVDIDAIALTLVKLSQLACDLDEVQELEINPLLADGNGVVALDARARIAALPASAARGRRLAIRPYPRELEVTEELAGLGTVLLRPIWPEDAPLLDEFFNRLSREDIRLRFFTPIHEMSPSLRARLTQIDYDREMAFVLLFEQSIIGVARLAADPDNRAAEFAVAVRSDLKGKGLGWHLMARLIDYAKARGIATLFGEVLRENTTMITMCTELGFVLGPCDRAGVVRASLNL